MSKAMIYYENYTKNTFNPYKCLCLQLPGNVGVVLAVFPITQIKEASCC